MPPRNNRIPDDFMNKIKGKSYLTPKNEVVQVLGYIKDEFQDLILLTNGERIAVIEFENLKESKEK